MFKVSILISLFTVDCLLSQLGWVWTELFVIGIFVFIFVKIELTVYKILNRISRIIYKFLKLGLVVIGSKFWDVFKMGFQVTCEVCKNLRSEIYIFIWFEDPGGNRVITGPQVVNSNAETYFLPCRFFTFHYPERV